MRLPSGNQIDMYACTFDSTHHEITTTTTRYRINSLWNERCYNAVLGMWNFLRNYCMLYAWNYHRYIAKEQHIERQGPCIFSPPLAVLTSRHELKNIIPNGAIHIVTSLSREREWDECNLPLRPWVSYSIREIPIRRSIARRGWE